jgi:hypothetical protein
MNTKIDSRQIKNVAALPQVGSAANETLKAILPAIDAELSKLFEDRNLLLVDGGTITVNTDATSVSFSASLKLHVNSLVSGLPPSVIDLASTTRAFTANGNMLYAIINRTVATATVVTDASSLPSQIAANQEIVLIAKRVGTSIYFRNGSAIPAGRSVTLGASDLYGNLGSVTNQLVKTNGTDGKTVQGTGITVDASNNITGVVSQTVATNIVTEINAENITVNSITTGANATLPIPTTPIIKLTNTTLSSLDGIPAGIAGQQITLINDTATTILLNNNIGAIASNRIYTGLSKPLSLKNTASVLLKYDTILNRWRVIGGSGSGSGASSGSGGGELADLMYSCAIRESFTDILNGTTPTDVSIGKTDASIFDIANELMRINYDASKTVTGTSINMTISAAPSYTVKVGDMLIYGNEARKINTVTSQTIYVLESAFSTNPTSSACCISQAVHTVDLNNFTNGGLGLSAASQYSSNIDEIMLGYQDSAALNDIIPDFGSTATVAFSASTDTNSWTTNRARVSSLSSSEVPVTCPTSNTSLYLRFFSNATTGSGAVNLLSYKVFFQKQIGDLAGGTYYTAFARPTSSIAQNCSIGLIGGKTRFTFTFPYTRGLNASEASGSILEVIADGQIIPRFTAGITDNTQAYFIEINDTTIEMDTDYTSAGIDFQFKVQRVGIIDTNTQNTIRISALETTVAGLGGNELPNFSASLVDGIVSPIFDWETPAAPLSVAGTIPLSVVSCTEFSKDGQFFIALENNTPYAHIYQKSNTNTWTRIGNLSTLPVANVTSCSWSPNGQFLVITGYNQSTSLPTMYLYQRSGTTFTIITSMPSLPTANFSALYNAKWTSDSKYVAFVTSQSPYLWVYKRNGTTFTKLANPVAGLPGFATSLDWSNDGKYLYVSSNNAGTTSGLTIFKKTGDTLVKITTATGLSAISSSAYPYVSLSPDSSILSIGLSDVDGTRKLYNYTMSSPLDFNLLPDVPDAVTAENLNYGIQLSWSSNSKYLIVVWNSDSLGFTAQINIYERSSTNTFTKLTGLPGLWEDAVPGRPSWSVDGRFLVIPQYGGGYFKLYETNADLPTAIGVPNIKNAASR